MIFALAAASNFSSLTVKIVFSLGFSSAGASADDEEAAAEAGAAAAGRAISVMLSFVYGREVRLMVKMSDSRREWRTLRAVTSSETSNKLKEEMLSTMGAILGLTGASPAGVSEKVGRELEKDRRTTREEEEAGRS